MISSSIDLSILVTFHNHEKFVEQNIESIVNQQRYTNLINFEVLLFDDASQDRTRKIISDNLKKFHVPCQLRGPTMRNVGVVNARNFLLDTAKNKWILMVDGDDYLLDNCLEIIYDKIQSNPDFNVYQYAYNYFTKDIKLAAQKGVHRFADMHPRFYAWGFLWSNSGQLRYSQKYQEGWEDIDFNLRLLKYYEKCLAITKKDLPIMNYRIHYSRDDYVRENESLVNFLSKQLFEDHPELKETGIKPYGKLIQYGT